MISQPSPTRSVIILVGALLLYLALITNFHHFKYGLHFLQSISYATGGWVPVALMVGLIGFTLIIGIWLIGFGDFPGSFIGLVPKKLPFALAAVAATWIVGQALVVISCIFFHHRFAVADPPLAEAIPLLLTQVLGNSLLEESFFRGFLIPFSLPYLRNSRALAVIATSVVFGVSHIPALLATGQPFVSLISITILGLVFGWLYIRTGNLWLCIGLHSLFNRPTLIWSSHISGQIVPLLVIFFFIAFSTRLFRMPTFQFSSQGVGV